MRMISFIDRKVELERMEKDYKTKGSTLYIIYGRRRVGKTTLLQKFISEKTHYILLPQRRVKDQI